ncbi:MAG: pyridoxine 5'-phosphate synthase, partial [Longimicrobiales bacterium]
MRLYINIDHVATVRQARGTDEPDPVRAAVLAELGGADGITIHLRADRRHIQDRDVRLLAQTARTGINFELATSKDIVDLAVELKPMQVTLVPEKREEVTTEGGLNLGSPEVREANAQALERLKESGARASLFIDPDPAALDYSAGLGAAEVEL